MIELKDITKTYRMGSVDVPALKSISLEIKDGEFIAIMGPSGSGKSTLMNILGCLDVPTTGRYLLDGIDVGELSDSELAEIRNEKLGFVFQTFNLLPRLTAFSNVELPLVYGGDQKDRRQRAMSALSAVDLEARASHRPAELSGGQRQRAAIARALVNNPGIILADEPTGNLDTKSGREITSILTDLNRSGITVVIVTHDESVASCAERVIRLLDGAVVQDTAISGTNEVCSTNTDTQRKTKRGAVSLSGLRDNLSMAVSAILSSKLRSSLTMLGVMVGVIAVIAMIGIGSGASRQVTERISEMGANLLMVFPGAFQRGPARGASGGLTSLTYDDAQAIAKQCPSVAKVDASYSRNAQVVYGNHNTNTSVNGVTPNYPEVSNFPVDDGRFFTDEDNRLTRRVALLGKTTAENLFGEEDPIGEYVKINRTSYQVIGIMSEKGSSGFRDEDDVVFVPLRTAQKRLFGVDHVSIINASVKSVELVDKASAEITALLRRRHRIGTGEESDFSVLSQASILSTVEETGRTFTVLLAGIAAVSLVVGGIGIMNIMFVSVSERTREIGIRKAIGAQRRDILTQFLIEAVIVSLSGGAVGILFGVLTTMLVGSLGNWPTAVSFGAILVSFSFALMVGLFFGFYPARRAALLSPIEALRYE